MAHIPDGFLSAPVLVGTAAVSGAALTVAVRRSRRALGEREAPVLGAVTAFVFAAQMLNFPLGVGLSGHFLGGVLVAALLGPWSGMLAMFAVVLVQALLFQDGGIAALGANTLNLAVLGVGGGYLGLRWMLGLTGSGSRRQLLAASVSAVVVTTLVGTAVAFELAASRVVPLRSALVAVAGAHLVIGVVEAALTAAILAAVLRSRPDFVVGLASAHAHPRGWVIAVTSVAVAAAAGAGYLASGNPDAVLRIGNQLGMLPPGTDATIAPLAGYTAPVGGRALAGVLGVVTAFGVAWVVVWLLRKRRAAS
jgi:cobalt/nickel transport system permease protein